MTPKKYLTIQFTQEIDSVDRMNIYSHAQQLSDETGIYILTCMSQFDGSEFTRLFTPQR